MNVEINKITAKKIHRFEPEEGRGFVIIVEEPDKTAPRERQGYFTFAEHIESGLILPLKAFRAWEGETLLALEQIFEKTEDYLFAGEAPKSAEIERKVEELREVLQSLDEGLGFEEE